jgi:uncharacterized protein
MSDPHSATEQGSRPANRLANETSPYLQQHAFNPVDWHPWGPEALELAKKQDKPIFLSIGYSACHWCHVMERESFEDPATAAVMNEHFINIKVDREERPDLDQIYMNAVQLMTMQGGWPMSVWLTPDLKPFYGGTYFPPSPRYGRPSFRDVLLHLAKAYRERREEIDSVSKNLVESMQEMERLKPAAEAETPEAGLLVQGARAILHQVDRELGGIGRAPKFPHTVELRVLLNAGAELGDSTMTGHAIHSIESMIRGGIYDQLGGGLHRYSTDREWLVPHFEKMLYDNALFARACLEAWQFSKRPIFERALRETLDYVLREMTSPDGPFYSTQDADSEEHEGKFFVWSLVEVQEVLGEKRAKQFAEVYDVTKSGNWEGANILHLPALKYSEPDSASPPPDDPAVPFTDDRRKLFERRERRIKPGRDEKILTAWNGMMIDALASASAVLEEAKYLEGAERAADWLLNNMRTSKGRLLRTAHLESGQPPKLNAYLEDYAWLANGLVSLYEASFDPRWLQEASRLIDETVALFWDDKEGGFFFTGSDHETLIARSKDPHDGATPSGNSVTATALARLFQLVGDSTLADRLDKLFAAFRGTMAERPSAAAQMLLALRFHVGPTFGIALTGEAEHPVMRANLRTIHQRLLPNKVLAMRRSESANDEEKVALLRDKPVEKEPLAYVCRNFTCAAPVGTTEELASLLNP